MELYLIVLNGVFLVVIIYFLFILTKLIRGNGQPLNIEKPQAHRPQSLNEDLMHLIPCPSIKIDTDGLVVDFNHLAKKVLPNVEYGKISEVDLIISPNEPMLPFKEAFTKRETVTKTFGYQSKIYQLTIVPYYRDSNIAGFFEIFKDVTELETLRKEKSQRSKLETVGHLSMGMAHDFNNILQVIMGHAELCLDYGEVPDSYVENIETIINAGEKASALTRQLLIFSRKQEGDMKVLSINTIINDMYKMLDRLLGENVKIELKLVQQDLKFKADEIHVEQVIMNLCVNARDAMPSGGTIKISTENIEVMKGDFNSNPERLAGKYIKLSIADTGTGISQEHIEKIFEPFFTTKAKDKGTGLGLANVQGIVKQYNGFIDIESNIGFGTVFKIYLPIRHADGEEGLVPINITKKLVKGKFEHVLVIEDDNLICNVMKKMLGKNNYKVTVCRDMKSATDQLNEKISEFDLIISDLILPDGNGYELYNSLNSLNNKIPFIITSGYSEEKPELKALIEAGVCFLKKPFSVTDLLKDVNKVLNQK